MGSRTDAAIEAWQKHAGLEPATGEHLAALDKLSDAAYELIKVIQLEASGIRDGDGHWHGSDVLANSAVAIVEQCKVVQRGMFPDIRNCLSSDLCPRCGAHDQATHHPACQARDGTPTELSDEEVRTAIATCQRNQLNEWLHCNADSVDESPVTALVWNEAKAVLGSNDPRLIDQACKAVDEWTDLEVAKAGFRGWTGDEFHSIYGDGNPNDKDDPLPF